MVDTLMVERDGVQTCLRMQVAPFGGSLVAVRAMTGAGVEVASLSLLRLDGISVVNAVWVDEDVRRQGVASALWRAAERAGLNPHHDVPAHRTPEGHAWAQAVGGPVDEGQACTCYACDLAPELLTEQLSYYGEEV